MIEAISARNTSSDAGASTDADAFAAFVLQIEPRLRRAFVGEAGVDGAHDATAEALLWAWENWSQVTEMSNPAGYLYRVGRSSLRIRRPKKIRYLIAEPTSLPSIEPGLIDALAHLPERQRTVVWLVYACEWSYREVAQALDISASAVGTHASRGLTALRQQIGAFHG